ncbi:MAG: class I SAM-dependent methyltransferase, partial [Thermosynechococcaceae cyanobacterium]
MKLSFLTLPEQQAWQQITGWLLPDAAETLYRYASLACPNGVVVEIGSFSGKSTVCLARALKDHSDKSKLSKMVAIDIQFQLNFKKNLARLGIANYVSTMESSSLDAVENWNQPISFLYIDGHHGKAHAYADLMVWDAFVIPGGIVALDDTAGFMLGPNLQLQSAIRTGAYELLSDVGGVSFLQKKKALIPPISEYPFSMGSLAAYMGYVSAWLGAMDPAFRLPQMPNNTKSLLGRAVVKLWDTSPKQLLDYILVKFTSRKQVHQFYDFNNTDEDLNIPNEFKKIYRVLEWLKMEGDSNEAIKDNLLYLNACLEIRLKNIDNSIKKFEILSKLNKSIKFINYNISINELSMLRLAQSYDLYGFRDKAKVTYQALL